MTPPSSAAPVGRQASFLADFGSWGIALLSCLCILAVQQSLPSGGLSLIAGDEGSEFIKGYLLFLGFPLYSQIWTDQPPLFSQLLASWFTIVGNNVDATRHAVLVCMGGGLFCLGEIVRVHSGLVIASVTVVLLVSSQYFIRLAPAVMVAAPTLVLSLMAIYCAMRYTLSQRLIYLVGSGVLFGCAICTKLTAILYLPAFFLAVSPLCPSQEQTCCQKFPKPRVVLLWMAMVGITALISLAPYLPGAFTALVANHVGHLGKSQTPSLEFSFKVQNLWEDTSFQWLLGLGILYVIISRSAVGLVLLIWLCGCIAIHAIYHPYWGFYWLHFGVQICWLGALAVVECFRWCIRGFGFSGRYLVRGVCLAAVVLASAILIRERASQFGYQLELLRLTTDIAKAPFFLKIQSMCSRLTMIYTDTPLVAFALQLPTPPEVAFPVLKRVWNDPELDNIILSALIRHKPEAILISGRTELSSELRGYIAMNYRIANQDDSLILYIATARF